MGIAAPPSLGEPETERKTLMRWLMNTLRNCHLRWKRYRADRKARRDYERLFGDHWD